MALALALFALSALLTLACWNNARSRVAAVEARAKMLELRLAAKTYSRPAPGQFAVCSDCGLHVARYHADGAGRVHCANCAPQSNLNG